MTDVATEPTTDEGPFGDIVFEAIPASPKRPPGKGREPIKWEEHLAPLESRLLDSPARLWAYEVKTGAVSRMSAVRNRLYNAAPAKNWEFKVRPVPNTSPQLYGVYAVFHGDYTPDEQLKAAQARAGRRERVTKANAARTAVAGTQGATEATESVPQEAPAQTPKERLAASRK
jgi:hypothetical protein